MAAWKQLLIALVVIVAATAAWVAFFPGAPAMLAKWGIDLPQAAAKAAPDGQASGLGERRQRGGGDGPKTAVVTAPIATATINDKLSAVGTGRANASVVVNPYTSGFLTEVLVKSGATVKAGDVIAKLDSDSETIAVDRNRMAINDATARLDRVRSLRTSNTATAVQVTDAELVESNAKLALRDAELTLERRSIRAPIDGVVGIIPVEVGNYVTSQTAIVTIDDRSTIKVDFYVPERYADMVEVGADLTAVPIAKPDISLKGVVAAIDNRLDEQSRTLHVQANIDNSGDALRAGMSFQVSMGFPGDTYPSVSPLAIQWGTEGAYVWAIRDGKAKRTPVRIVQRNTETVLVEADLETSDTVVTEGVHVVRDGAEVLVAGAETKPQPVPVAQGGG